MASTRLNSKRLVNGNPLLKLTGVAWAKSPCVYKLSELVKRAKKLYSRNSHPAIAHEMRRPYQFKKTPAYAEEKTAP